MTDRRCFAKRITSDILRSLGDAECFGHYSRRLDDMAGCSRN